MTAITLLVGSLTDAIGLRKTFFLGVWICIFARAVMAFTSLRWLALAGGLFPLAVGEALSTPVLVAAVRHYSTTRQRSISFSIFYVMMNVGFLAAALLFDFVRQGLGEHGHLTLPLLGVKISTYRALFLASLLIEISILPVLYFLRVGVEVTDEGVKITPRPAQGAAGEPLAGYVYGGARQRDGVRPALRRAPAAGGGLPAPGVPDPDRVPEADFDADVLCLSEVRHPGTGGWRADRPALGDQ